jgi:hypothetical protein
MNAVFQYLQTRDSIPEVRRADTITLHDSSHLSTQSSGLLLNSADGSKPAGNSSFMIASSEAATDSMGLHEEPSVKKNNIPEWNSKMNFLEENGLSGIQSIQPYQTANRSPFLTHSTQELADLEPRQRETVTFDWLFGIFIFLILLFVWIRIFYGKFFNMLANALKSFKIASNLFREKNALIQRVSILLDAIYLIVISIFTFELARYHHLWEAGMNRFNLFMIVLNVFIIYTVLRIIILQLTGYIFFSKSTFAEYIHSTFVVNKGVGIALFPVVIMQHYFPYQWLHGILIMGILIILMAFILKAIRAYQIIIRKDILIFYLILYLCTLEILPLLLGYKVIMSLI